MTGPDFHPRDAEAADYVLGTLSAAERQAFERDLRADETLMALVRAWEERLAPLAEAVPPVAPSPSTWPRILAATDVPGSDAVRAGRGQVIERPVSPELARLRRSRGLWRAATVAAASLAACLAVFVGFERLAPPPERLVAVVNRSGELPALIVRVDRAAGTVQVRSLAAEVPAGRSLELWSIVGSGPPRSLGTLGGGTTRVAVPAVDRSRLDGATLAVSVEPLGGSTTGGPTGPVIYSGKLVPDAE